MGDRARSQSEIVEMNEYSGVSQCPTWLMALWPSQGVVDLNPLGRKGYSVPKVGTIQVVSFP